VLTLKQERVMLSTLKTTIRAKNMRTMKEIRAELSDRRLNVVAKATGLHRETIYRIMRDENYVPNISTAKALDNYLNTKKA
jgi:DNA-binding XRE family transcriptional regulator